MVADEVEVEPPVSKEKKLKSKKKKKKKKKKSAEATNEVPSTTTTPDVETKSSEKRSKVSKKKKKKKVVEEEAVKSKDKKKKKKKRKREEGSKTKQATKKSKKVVDTDAIRKFREENKVTVHLGESGKETSPVLTLEEAKAAFPECARASFDACCKGFTKPSPIQAQAWPIVLDGKDMVGVAATGSGKTLAFVLPAVAKLLGGGCGPRPQSTATTAPRVLVLSPTRELAIQSAKVLETASSVLDNSDSMVIFGGQPKREQLKKLRAYGENLDCIVATPGRLLDFVEGESIDLSGVRYLVLDEADRMLDMGFEKDVKRIISMCAPENKQTVMFSATWPQEIREIARAYLSDPIRVVVGSDKLSASSSVKQHVEVLEPFAKERRLQQLLRKIHTGKNRIVVFGLYKKECARLEQTLLRQGFNAAGIHGDKPQHQREEAIRQFEKGEMPILVATDVASRGLDIENVEFVVNYTFPLTVEDYVHRIGRTGRAGKRGVAYTFFTSHEKHLAGALQNVLRQAGAEIPQALLNFGNTVKKKTHKLYGAHFRANDDDMPMKKATRIVFD